MASSDFVFASSGAPIGECEPPLHEELPAHPVSPYGASKLAGEAYCSAYKRSFGIETVALRFGNCYGPFSGTKEVSLPNSSTTPLPKKLGRFSVMEIRHAISSTSMILLERSSSPPRWPISAGRYFKSQQAARRRSRH